jgi:hypothetical protein
MGNVQTGDRFAMRYRNGNSDEFEVIRDASQRFAKRRAAISSKSGIQRLSGNPLVADTIGAHPSFFGTTAQGLCRTNFGFMSPEENRSEKEFKLRLKSTPAFDHKGQFARLRKTSFRVPRLAGGGKLGISRKL